MSRKTRQLKQLDSNLREINLSETYLSFRGQYTGSNLIYAGFSKPGSADGNVVWQIKKLTYDGTGNLTKIEWPLNSSGVVSSDFEFEWDNRATYTYQ